MRPRSRDPHETPCQNHSTWYTKANRLERPQRRHVNAGPISVPDLQPRVHVFKALGTITFAQTPAGRNMVFTQV